MPRLWRRYADTEMRISVFPHPMIVRPGDGYNVCWELWDQHGPGNQVAAGVQKDYPTLATRPDVREPSRPAVRQGIPPGPCGTGLVREGGGGSAESWPGKVDTIVAVRSTCYPTRGELRQGRVRELRHGCGGMRLCRRRIHHRRHRRQSGQRVGRVQAAAEPRELTKATVTAWMDTQRGQQTSTIRRPTVRTKGKPAEVVVMSARRHPPKSE